MCRSKQLRNGTHATQTAHLGTQCNLHSICQLVDTSQDSLAALDAEAHVLCIVARNREQQALRKAKKIRDISQERCSAD